MNEREREKKVKTRKIIRDVMIKYLVVYLIIFFVGAVTILTSICVYGISLGYVLDTAEVIKGGKVLAVVILSFSFILLLLYAIIIRATVGKSIERIREHLNKMSEGDFETELKKIRSPWGISEFNPIIEDINKTSAELRGMQSLRYDFLNNISHEFKTPLTVVKNYAKLLQQDEISSEVRIEYAKVISSSVDDLTSLVTNALRLNKIEHQSIFTEHERYNLSEQLALSIIYFEEQIEKKKLNVVIDITEDIYVDTDKNLLNHVWLNLLSNAIKFTPEYGTVTVSAKTSRNTVTVAVSDNGCGISDTDQPHIFDKYYQGDSGAQKKGIGLGLSLVKRIVDVLKMEISFESTPGEGTTFVVTMKI